MQNNDIMCESCADGKRGPQKKQKNLLHAIATMLPEPPCKVSQLTNQQTYAVTK